MKIVLDVNVWISALLWGGIPGEMLRLVRNQQVKIFTSEALFLELETTLRRVKFKSRLQQRGYTVEDLMSVAKAFSESCPTEALDIPELRDPKDIKIIEAALAGNVEAIITGDLDLLVLTEINAIAILTPQEFLNRYFPEIL